MIIGVHTPEFAFEHVASNVSAAVERLGIHYPVVQDNKYGTWTNYSNQYWPAHYLIDRQGRIRDYHFGEGGYGETEQAIRTLLGVSADAAAVADTTPTEITTPETYLGYGRLDPSRFADRLVTDRDHTYAGSVSLPADHFAYSGSWKVEDERIVAGRGAGLSLALPGEGRLPRARRQGRRARLCRREAHEHGARERLQALHAAQLAALCEQPPRPALHARGAGVRVHLRIVTARSAVGCRRRRPARARGGSG